MAGLGIDFDERVKMIYGCVDGMAVQERTRLRAVSKPSNCVHLGG